VLTNYTPDSPAPGWKEIPLTVLPLGVDLGLYVPAEPRSFKYLVAGIVARGSPEKVPPSFVRILSGWDPGPWRVRFIGIGTPNAYQEEMHRYLDRHRWVEWAGDLTPDEMPMAYKELDALLVPSVSETGSYAIVEAMACGLPVVARAVGGIPYQSGGKALLGKTDRELLTNLRAVEDIRIRRGLAAAAREEAVAHHSLKDHVAKHTEAYRVAAAARVPVAPVAPPQPPQPTPAPETFLAQAPEVATGLEARREPKSTVLPAPPPIRRAAALVNPDVPPNLGRPVILHVVAYELSLGGGQRMLNEWCERESWRWNVHIATGSRNPPLWPFKGATIHHLNGEEPQELEALCAILKPDVVVSHNVDHGFSIGGAAWPQVWYLHGEGILRQPPPSWGRPGAFITNYPQEPGPGWEGIRQHIVRLGVDTKAYHPKDHEDRGAFIVGIIGRLSRDKVPPDFVEAVKAWQPGRWKIRFVGSAPGNAYADRLQAELASVPFVEFTGDMAPQNMPLVYHQLDAVLIPSSTETGSYVLIEGMASGLPVVCRDLPGPRYVGSDIPMYAKDAKGLLEALRGLDDPAARKELGSRGREYAVANLDIDAEMRKITAVYASVAQPRVSVLMPVYNGNTDWLRETVQTVYDQTEPLWELVMVDDGSTKQETLDLEAFYEGPDGDPRINVNYVAHGGCAAALNKGLRFCRCELVARMDSDDWMLPERLARQRAYMLAHPEVDVLGTQMSWSDKDAITQHEAVVDLAVLSRRDFVLNHPTVMYRGRMIEAMGGYDETLKAVEDFDMWLRLAKAGKIIHNLPDVLLRYRCHPGQMSKVNPIAQIIKQLRTKNGVAMGSTPTAAPTDLGEVFDHIYKGGPWGPPLSSGEGSTMQATEIIRVAIRDLLMRRAIKSMVDAGCGNSSWMREAVPPTVERYIGMDVSSSIIALDKTKPAIPGWEFRVGDLSNGTPNDRVDLVLCRDVLTHLDEARVLAALRNAKEMAPLLLTTQWPDIVNEDIPAGEWRKLDLEAAPYGLPKPLEVFHEVDQGKTLALFDLTAWTPAG